MSYLKGWLQRVKWENDFKMPCHFYFVFFYTVFANIANITPDEYEALWQDNDEILIHQTKTEKGNKGLQTYATIKILIIFLTNS